MPELLTEFPERQTAVDRFSPYLDGRVWKLSLQESECSGINSLVSGLRSAAHAKGLKARIQQNTKKGFVVVQSFTPEGRTA